MHVEKMDMNTKAGRFIGWNRNVKERDFFVRRYLIMLIWWIINGCLSKIRCMIDVLVQLNLKLRFGEKFASPKEMQIV